MKKILMLHGINANMFGYREPGLYGTITYEQLNAKLREKAEELGIELEIFQSNFEGAFVEKIHQAFYDKTDAVVMNPGGWTNDTGVMDAVAILKCPVIEVHMANLFKKHGGTVTGKTIKNASGCILGQGWLGYITALEAAVELCDKD